MTTIPQHTTRVTERATRFAVDAIDALACRASHNAGLELSDGAQRWTTAPLWAIAGECLKLTGRDVDMHGDKETIASEAMQMGIPGHRRTFYSENEDRRYIGATAPLSRPGDFPNILSGLANKFFDTVQLDDEYSYSEISAVLPGGLRDFRPGVIGSMGLAEELDEIRDGEKIKDLDVQEEVLSSIHMRRFANKWGWTPVMVANDDMQAFSEGMIGIAEAWEVTQNRLVLATLLANEQLLDGQRLFADRGGAVGGSSDAANDNDRTTGAAPSDAEWGAMEELYADISGIGTNRRVRGTLNVALVPTGAPYQEARRTFMPLNAGGLEGKVANTTDHVGLYRGQVKVVPDSELRTHSDSAWYGFRSPTRLSTATIARAYFSGYGARGRRETWYDPETKTSYVSLEGRIAVAVKNWRYAIRNAGVASAN